MRQVPDYLAKKTLRALVAVQSECVHFRPRELVVGSSNSGCRFASPKILGCSVCELVAYWREDA